MTTHRMQVGMCFDRTFPPSDVTEFARALDTGGADQLWIIEDCFYTGGVSLAAAALAATERLTVGVGILPAVARTAAVTAMEIATLCGIAPGRVLPGIGHGVQRWMQQMGVRPASPLTALEEVLVAVGRLLDGEEVSVEGHYVRLEGVRLDQPPAQRPPILAGVQQAKSLALAGRVADGVVLAEPGSPSYVRWTEQYLGAPEPFHRAVFSVVCVRPERRDAYHAMAPWVAAQLVTPSVGMRALPFFDDLAVRHERDGLDGILTMPREWWAELAPIGTMDDALAHLAALEAAGVDSVGLYPSLEVAVAREQVADVVRLARR